MKFEHQPGVISSEIPNIDFLGKEVEVDLWSCNPWNLPDWTDIAAYPCAKITSNLRWRWEFLRRDDNYRNLWILYQRNRDLWERSNDNGESIRQVAGKAFNLRDLISPASEFSVFIEMDMWDAGQFDIWMGAVSAEKFARDALSRGLALVAVKPGINRKRIWREVDEHLDSFYYEPAWRSSSVDAGLVHDLPMEDSPDSQALDQTPPTDRLPRIDRVRYPIYLQALDAKTELDRDVELTWEDVAEDLYHDKNGEILEASSASKRYKAALNVQRKLVNQFGI